MLPSKVGSCPAPLYKILSAGIHKNSALCRWCSASFPSPVGPAKNSIQQGTPYSSNILCHHLCTALCLLPVTPECTLQCQVDRGAQPSAQHLLGAVTGTQNAQPGGCRLLLHCPPYPLHTGRNDYLEHQPQEVKEQENQQSFMSFRNLWLLL